MNQTAKPQETAQLIKPISLNAKKIENSQNQAARARMNVFQNKHWVEIFRRAVDAQQQINLPSLHL